MRACLLVSVTHRYTAVASFWMAQPATASMIASPTRRPRACGRTNMLISSTTSSPSRYPPPSRLSSSHAPGPCPIIPSAASARQPVSGRGASDVTVIPGQPVLGGHPDHDLAGAWVGRDVGVAALGSQVPAGQFEPFGLGGLLHDDRALDRDVLVGQPLLLGAQADPARRLDGQGLAGAAAGTQVHRAARLVGVPDRDGQR